MPKHEVRFKTPTLEVGKADLEFEIRRDGELVGTLLLSKGALVWCPPNAQKGHKLEWTKFHKLAVENGVKESAKPKSNEAIEFNEEHTLAEIEDRLARTHAKKLYVIAKKKRPADEKALYELALAYSKKTWPEEAGKEAVKNAKNLIAHLRAHEALG